MIAALLAALTWEPQIKGALYVILAVAILCGSCYLLLSTNMGARLGFQLAAAGLFGFLATIGIIWWVYGIGPIGASPSWKPQGIVTGDLATSRNPALERFPRDWKRLAPTDPAVADAQGVVDGQLVSSPGNRRLFSAPNEFVLLGAYKKGGENYGPFGLNFRPFNVFHKAHYLVVQVQKVRDAPGPAAPQPRPEPDPSAQPVSVVLLRDLGSERRNPAIFALSSMALFALLCYQLHTRDKEAAALREREARSPEPVSR